MDTRQRKLAIGLMAMVVITISVIQFPSFGSRVVNVSYSEFKALVRKGKVSNLVLDRQTISGSLTADGFEGLLPKEKIEELKGADAGARVFVTTVLTSLAKLLIEKEVVSREDLTALLGSVTA